MFNNHNTNYNSNNNNSNNNKKNNKNNPYVHQLIWEMSRVLDLEVGAFNQCPE
uniref:Uncharacterized protein n=1 Tax=Anguilla anguilla TaxID=7936 RepID=A0A0E9UYI3_ANGAN